MATREPNATRERALRLARSSPGIGPVVVLATVLTIPIGLAVMVDGATYDTWGAVIWGPILLLLALPLCRWVAHKTNEPDLVGFLFAAAALKIVIGAVTRYYMVDAVYGAGDSQRYDDAAALLAEPFRRGIFQDLGQITGTRFLEIVDGVVQAVIGQTMVGSFLVFAAFGFVGLCLLYLAFCEALPNGDHTLYRRLLFLTPSVWFWPSSVGKEAFLLMCVGAVAYGVVLVLDGRLRGLVLGGLGMWGVAVVRPHLALIAFLGVLAALPPTFAFRRSDDAAAGHEPRRRIARFALPLLIVTALPAVLGSAERFFNIDGLNVEAVSALRTEVVRRTSQGGSDFSPPDTGNPNGLLEGIITVTARPFPWEARGFSALASLESVVLGAICGVAMGRRRLALVRSLGQRWPRFSLAYVVAFGWAFSAVANFGILSRQRSLMLPFLFVLVASATRPDRPRPVAGPQPPAAPAMMRS